MIKIRAVTGTHEPHSDFIRNLVEVFISARRAHLKFLINLHTREEDCHYLSGVMLPQNQLWVAEVDNYLTGFMALAPGWINHLYISPGYQRQSLGSRLLTIAKQTYPTLQLWAFQVNIPAIKFYGHHGFQEVERTDGANNEAKMPDLRMQWHRNTQ